MNPLFDQLSGLVAAGGPREELLASLMNAILAGFHSETGTLHRLEADTQCLKLVAQKGLPPQLLDIVGTIPVGKGIAGEVAAKNRPVTLCNLQTDTSGVANRARAKPVLAAPCVCPCATPGCWWVRSGWAPGGSTNIRRRKPRGWKRPVESLRRCAWWISRQLHFPQFLGGNGRLEE